MDYWMVIAMGLRMEELKDCSMEKLRDTLTTLKWDWTLGMMMDYKMDK